MTQILRIDSSSRTENSHSRELADYFQQTWLEEHPQGKVFVRDLVQTQLPHLSATAISLRHDFVTRVFILHPNSKPKQCRLQRRFRMN